MVALKNETMVQRAPFASVVPEEAVMVILETGRREGSSVALVLMLLDVMMHTINGRQRLFARQSLEPVLCTPAKNLAKLP